MTLEAQKSSNSISTLNEKSLYADLKVWYARPGDQFEVCTYGFIFDIARDKLLAEIQSKDFSAIRSDLSRLTDHRCVRLV